MRLSPQDPQKAIMHSATAFAHFIAGRYGEALASAETAVRERPSLLLATCVIAASGALSGKPAESAKAMSRLRQNDPTLRISNLKNLIPIRRSEDFERWSEGLRGAGLPE